MEHLDSDLLVNNKTETRRCYICGLVKYLETDFFKNKTQKLGFGLECKSCIKIKRFKNWAQVLINSAKANSKRYNSIFKITVTDVFEIFEKQNGQCYWFNIPLLPSINNFDPQQPTIDRLIPKFGYIPKNIVLSCLAANVGRSNMPEDVFRSFVNLVKNTEYIGD